MASHSSRRPKRSYIQKVIDEPFIVGKFPTAGDRAHGVKDRGLFYRVSFFHVLSLIPLALTGGAIYLAISDWNVLNAQVLVGCLALSIVLFLISFTSRKTCRCPLCRGSSLIDGKNRKNEKAFRIRPISFGTAASLTILTANRFRCCHCGTSFSLSGKHPKNKK